MNNSYRSDEGIIASLVKEMVASYAPEEGLKAEQKDQTSPPKQEEKMSVYTGNGDKGLSSTIKYTEVSKSHPIFDVLGTIDELISTIGVALITASQDVAGDLKKIQEVLSGVGTEISGGSRIDVEREIAFLEERINKYKALGVTAATLIGTEMYGGAASSETGARINVARTVARRLERVAIIPHGEDRVRDSLLAFFNRLSGYLLVLAKYCDSGKTGETNGNGASNLSRCSDAITLESAKLLCEAVIQVARKMDMKVVTAVVDSGGNTVSVLRDGDAYIASIDIATNKAWTCVALKMTTEEVGRITADGADLKGLENTNNGRIINFGGGIPLKVGGKIIGGFGVSGGNAEQDTLLAHAAQRIFEEMIRGGL